VEHCTTVLLCHCQYSHGRLGYRKGWVLHIKKRKERMEFLGTYPAGGGFVSIDTPNVRFPARKIILWASIWGLA